MQRVLCLCQLAGLLLFVIPDLQAQSREGAKAQEDFALAVAAAHARTSLFVADSKPFSIHAAVVSGLALRGIGKGTYDNQWIDAQHWYRVIQFPDFQQSEMRNDSGHSWIEQSDDTIPLRIGELLRVIVIHVPSSTGASGYLVSESSVAGDDGEALTCYSATPPTPPDGFQRRFRWCFDRVSGLLVSQDMPLNRHVSYSNYIDFQGKQEFTHVRVTSGSLPVLDAEIQYSPLDMHALDGAMPSKGMHRSASAGSSPNPEELGKGTVEYRFSPSLPSGTPDEDKKKPVELQFQVSADNQLVDAYVEDAPTIEMAEAALQASRRFTFTPLTLDGKPVGNRFYYSVWFKSDADDASSSGEAAGTAGLTNEHAPANLKSDRVYRSAEPPFTFHYPTGFEQIPRGEMEEERHTRGRPDHYGLEPGAQCDTLLFKVQRLPAGERVPDVLSIIDLAPNCIFGPVTSKALEAMAQDAARSLVNQMVKGSLSKPKRYLVNGHDFVVVSTSGSARRTVAEPLNALVVVTTIHHHVVAWEILGSQDKSRLEDILVACTLQIDEEKETSLLPLSAGH